MQTFICWLDKELNNLETLQNISMKSPFTVKAIILLTLHLEQEKGDN